MVPERLVSLRARTVLTVLGVLLAVAVVLEVVWVARTVITWILVALFVALALNPAVDWTERRIHRGRGAAVAVIFIGALLAVALLAALVIPTLAGAPSPATSTGRSGAT